MEFSFAFNQKQMGEYGNATYSKIPATWIIPPTFRNWSWKTADEEKIEPFRLDDKVTARIFLGRSTEKNLLIILHIAQSWYLLGVYNDNSERHEAWWRLQGVNCGVVIGWGVERIRVCDRRTRYMIGQGREGDSIYLIRWMGRKGTG